LIIIIVQTNVDSQSLLESNTKSQEQNTSCQASILDLHGGLEVRQNGCMMHIFFPDALQFPASWFNNICTSM